MAATCRDKAALPTDTIEQVLVRRKPKREMRRYDGPKRKLDDIETGTREECVMRSRRCCKRMSQAPQGAALGQLTCANSITEEKNWLGWENPLSDCLSAATCDCVLSRAICAHDMNRRHEQADRHGASAAGCNCEPVAQARSAYSGQGWCLGHDRSRGTVALDR